MQPFLVKTGFNRTPTCAELFRWYQCSKGIDSNRFQARKGAEVIKHFSRSTLAEHELCLTHK